MSELESSMTTPKFESRKAYLDYLGSMMVPPTEEEEEEEVYGDARGRPRLLKTYVMEANRGFPSNKDILDIAIEQTDTGLQDVNVLTLRHEAKSARFFVDTSDRRFWLLHTNALADEAKWLFERLVYSPKATFDKIWLPKRMVTEITEMPRNEFRGFGLDYVDYFGLEQQTEKSLEELSMHAYGSSSMVALDALSREKKLQNSIATSMVRVRRGDRQEYVIDEVAYDGRFSARGGTSIDAYTSLIEITTKKYRNLIENIERNSLGIKEVEGRTLVKGRAFDFNFDREIPDINLFLSVLASSKKPFRIWGLKNKMTNGIYQVFGVDLHTGDSIDMEVSSNLMRIYLPENSCGNTILRLYTNLQHHFDSKVKLNEEEIEANE
jgi:hypothetical protein